MNITQHSNSILNPDAVRLWIAEDKLSAADCLDRAFRGEALLPSIQRYASADYPRAAKAVELWFEASR